jgi:muconate cycloisomerase
LQCRSQLWDTEPKQFPAPGLRAPPHLAIATITEHTLVLVRIRDDEGREGLGEVAIIPHYGAETQRGVCQVIADVLAPNLLGKDPTSIEALIAQMDQLIKRNAYAKGAVEMACVDLAVKTVGLSADALFGGRVRGADTGTLGAGDGRRQQRYCGSRRKGEAASA